MAITTRKVIRLARTSNGCYATIELNAHTAITVSSKSSLEVARVLKELGFTTEDLRPVSNNNDYDFTRNLLKNFVFQRQ